MPYQTRISASPHEIRSDIAVSRSVRRFIAYFLLWLLCALLSYWTAVFYLPHTPDIVYRLSFCDTPQSTAAWLELLIGWLSGCITQLCLIFFGTISFFPAFFTGAVAIWRGFCMGSSVWLFTHTSVSMDSTSGISLFLTMYFVLSILFLFYGTMERHSRFLNRIPGFLLLSGVSFCLYLTPLLSTVIFL